MIATSLTGTSPNSAGLISASAITAIASPAPAIIAKATALAHTGPRLFRSLAMK